MADLKNTKANTKEEDIEVAADAEATAVTDSTNNTSEAPKKVVKKKVVTKKK